MLTRRAGAAQIELVEDAVQAALAAALTAWTDQALPEDPGAWVYRVACNQLTGDLRRQAEQSQIDEADAEREARGGRPPP